MNDEDIKIEKGIPIHARYPGSKQASIFERLPLLESFVVPDAEAKKWKGRTFYYSKLLKRRFCWRDQKNGFHRCWRIL